MKRKNLLIILVAIIFMLPKNVFATDKSADEAINWVNSKVGGECLDIDGAAGCQCVDLILAYFDYLGVPHTYGNGGDYASARVKSYVEGYGWQQIQGATPQKGDILVYTDGSYGHVGIYESDYSHYHQNVNGQSNVTHITSYSYTGFNAPTTYWGVIRPNFSNADTIAPTVTEYYVDPVSMTSNSYTVRAKATDNVGVTRVRFATWSLKEDANGESQDDLVWHEGVYNSNTGYWEYTVRASEHNNETGVIYRTHVYAYDAKGNRSTSGTLQHIPMGSTLNTSLANQFVARISAYGLDQSNSWVVGLASTSGTSIRLKLRQKDYTDDSQLWSFVKNSDNTYSITNVKTGLSIDVEGGQNIEGRLFLAFTKNNQDNQKFYLMNYNGGIRIVPKMSNDLKAMDLKGAQLVDGAEFELYESKAIDKANHTFSFLKVATDITLSESSIELNVGATKQVNVTYTPSDTDLKNVSWISSNTSVATVTSNGLIKAISKGTATITATTIDGTNITKSITITVTKTGGIIVLNGKSYYYDSNDELQTGLIHDEVNNYYYYADSNGVLQKGLNTINGKKYYFGSNYRMVRGNFITIDGKIYFFSATDGAMKLGWFTRSNKKYYADKTTGVIAIGFKTIDSKKYYFDNTGIMQTGLQVINNSTYYFNTSGIMQTGMITIDDKTYYFNTEGKMIRGKFITDNNELYFFSSNDGALKKTGWFTVSGKKYYADKTTGVIAIGFKTIDSKTYYFNDTGIMQTGLQVINNSTYYFNTLGAMQTGFQTIDGKTYYFNNVGKRVKGQFVRDNGKLYFISSNDATLKKTGWFTVSGKKYYADKTTGVIAIGVKNISGNIYYFDENGVMQTGFQTIDGKTYYFNSTGKRISGQFIRENGVLYFISSNDATLKKTGWFTVSGKKYYADKTTGVIAIGFKTINGKMYYFDDNGILQKTGWYTKSGNTYYLDKTTGEVFRGRYIIDNVEYEFNQSGVLNSRWRTENGKTYYYYLDGNKATGWVNIEGVKCFFNNSGALIKKNALKVIDVSYHNSIIDWNTVNNTDVDGAIIRLGYGTSYTTDEPFLDPQFGSNYTGTVNHNLLFGIYLYSYAIDEVSANLEADFMIHNLTLNNVSKNQIIYYDLEENNWTKDLTPNDYDIIIRTFTNRLAQAGYEVQVYTYKFWAENKLSDYGRSRLGWIAQYNDECSYQGSYQGWQYTASGSVNGINGVVDISVF